jgi:hypothetical protein
MYNIYTNPDLSIYEDLFSFNSVLFRALQQLLLYQRYIWHLLAQCYITANSVLFNPSDPNYKSVST